MLEQIDSGLSPASGLLQLIIVYVCTYIPVLTVAHIHGAPDTPMLSVLEYGSLVFSSAVLAVAISSVFPNSSREGRFIWVLPAALELLTMAAFLFGGVTPLHKFFYVGPSETANFWVIFLLTWPAWHCCWYSVMMWWRNRDLSSRRDLAAHV